MPHYLYFGMHGWPVLAFYVTFAQEQLILQKRQRLHTYVSYSTPLLFHFATYLNFRPPHPLNFEGKNIKFKFLSLSLATQLKQLFCTWAYLTVLDHLTVF